MALNDTTILPNLGGDGAGGDGAGGGTVATTTADLIDAIAENVRHIREKAIDMGLSGVTEATKLEQVATAITLVSIHEGGDEFSLDKTGDSRQLDSGYYKNPVKVELGAGWANVNEADGTIPTAEQVLENTKFVNAEGDWAEGTMANNGKVGTEEALDTMNLVSSASFDIPAGYTSGGKIEVDNSRLYAALSNI
jgi:urease alpha subunit